MLHSVSGGCYGNKQDLQRCMEEIESLEGSLSEIYAERLGMSKEEVKQTYFDGEDIADRQGSPGPWFHRRHL